MLHITVYNSTLTDWIYAVLTSDIWVCTKFYLDGRGTFFAISLTILLLALVSYTAAFVACFSSGYRFRDKVSLFIWALPFSPLLPFSFYYSDQAEVVFNKIFSCLGLRVSADVTTSTSSAASKFKQFFEKKIEKHFGFILESLVEGAIYSLHSTLHILSTPTLSAPCALLYIAFPQAILQMAAIVIYKEANTIAIISIFISLLSVASKSLVFMLGVSNSFKQLFFNWLCAVTDFFGIFFVVCWVFYEPQDESLEDAFSLIQSVWLWKLYIFELPGVIFPAFILYITYVWAAVTEFDTDPPHRILKKIGLGIAAFFGFSFMFFAGSIAGILFTEIMCWTWIAGLFLGVSWRLPGYHKLSLQFYFTLAKWIDSAERHQIGSRYKGCTSYTKQQDKMMRLGSANEILSGHGRFLGYSGADSTFTKYLKDHRVGDQYMKISFKGLRQNVNDDHRKWSQFTWRFWNFYGKLWKEIKSETKSEYDNWTRNHSMSNLNGCGLMICLSASIGSLTLFFTPFYTISRLVHVAFPWSIVLYLYLKYDLVIWTSSHIDTFQMVMITVYLVLCVILSVLMYLNAKEQYLLFHILPYKRQLETVDDDERKMDKVMREITNRYFGMTVIPIRRAIVIDCMGPDIGPIVVSYLPNDDDFGDVGGVVKVTTVV